MTSSDIQILIPCHSLEDFPTDHTDQPAESLLNAFATAFHPALLAWTSELPRWRRADDPPLPHSGQLILIPTVSDGWLPHSWPDDARRVGATVVTGLSDRKEMIAAALKAVVVDSESIDVGTDSLKSDPTSTTGEPTGTKVDHNTSQNEADFALDLPKIDDDLVADFLALGTCWLLIELLTRKMRQFGNIDDTRFFQRAHAGAKAAIANDRETAETHLRGCFEMLLEARERFYPVECYILDLCLAVPDVGLEKLLPDSQQPIPYSLLVSTDDLTEICEKTPGLAAAFIEARTAGRVSFVGGEDRESSLPLLPLESTLYHLEKGREKWRSLVGSEPVVWGRRRFGLSALLPQILVKFGFKAALHVVLDDGIYPDAEYTKLRWRGVDGTLIDALSRIPLAAEGAASYLRFPVRMAESMDHDQVAGLILARWPEVVSPWFEDLRRSQKYAACLGRFITLDRFFEQTELPGQLSVHKANEYFSPLLIQHVARSESAPITRYSKHSSARQRFETARWSLATAAVLQSKPIDTTNLDLVETPIESIQFEKNPDESTVIGLLEELEKSAPAELVRLIMHSAKSGSGYLILNSTSFARRAIVHLPNATSPPAIAGAVKAVEFDRNHPDRTACVVDIPGCGYAWIPTTDNSVLPPTPKQPLAEKWLLRNDLFEVAINERTGGVAHVRYHDQRTKRFSQQLSFRFPRERTISVDDESGKPIKSQYAEMRCLGSEVVLSGTACGEIVTFGEIFDQAKNERLASYRQNVRVWRACSTIEIEIELSDLKMPEGDPWNNYFASRFAWNDSTSAVTRSIYHSAHNYLHERFETSDYIEIASESERLTIVPHGLPFHRQSGDRMIDSMLVVSGERERRFRFTIAVDAQYPLEAAWNATVPIVTVATDSGPPRTGSTGWFFHVDARNVQLTRILEAPSSEKIPSPLEQFEQPVVPQTPGFAVRLVETEGRAKPIKLRCFRQPTFARKRDFRGETILELVIERDAVIVEMSAFEIVDVEIRFS